MLCNLLIEAKMWTCDTCKQQISKTEDGWVEWLMNKGEGKGKGLRIVHYKPASPLLPEGSCQYAERNYPDSVLYDLPLEQFLGPDGLMTLLSFLADSKLPKEEILETIKRLHVPGYEEARPYFNIAISEGVFEPNTAPGYYLQSNIQAVIKALAQGKFKS